MRPTPLPEDVPVKTAAYYNTAAWIEASHANGFPHQHPSFYNTVTPAPRFNPTVNPIGKTVGGEIASRMRDDNAYSPLVMGGWNVSGEPVRTLPGKIR